MNNKTWRRFTGIKAHQWIELNCGYCWCYCCEV